MQQKLKARTRHKANAGFTYLDLDFEKQEQADAILAVLKALNIDTRYEEQNKNKKRVCIAIDQETPNHAEWR